MAPTKNGSAVPDMADVFKTHPQPAVITDMVTKYRNLARKHLQETIPQKLTHIQSLLEGENDPSSILYTGHLLSEGYTNPLMLQPTLTAKDSLLPNQTVVLPSDVERARGLDEEEEGGDEMEKGSVKGVRAGPHWFEVVPQNKAQHELIQLSVKEHEDLHIISQDLRIWLELEIPVVEDGNSFGAEVQEHMIKECLEAYRKSNSFHNGCRAHYGDRLKLANDWVKFPNLMDYPAAIAASDRFDHFLLRSYLRSLLLIYGGLITKFEKTWTKVINPKGSTSSGGMY